MPTAQQLRKRLVNKLQELFQLDQPDLDFGFYRIMHAKAEQVKTFIKKDLLDIVEDAFGQADEARKQELRKKVEEEIERAREYGVPDPENSPKVKEAQAAFEALKETANSEAEVYDHLFRFFERYYDDGDFISRRYYMRETPGRAAPFAVPYNGEEVKLHWANADQYYIKTAEHFSNFTFIPGHGLSAASGDETQKPLFDDQITPRRVHFRIADASEGEHGNVKPSDANKRFFIIHSARPVDFNEDGELVVNFEYRPDPEKAGQDRIWREKRNAEAVETVLAALENYPDRSPKKESADYLHLLKTPAPTAKDKDRPLLAKYVNQYTARNTMDYFIHKDLDGFLRRELDFYIKNEVMRLDDIEHADAPTVESYLSKIKVIRRIAGKLIAFLGQLEDFQKRLWLKKKFVVETNYCITLDRVPEDLYPEIAANEAQHDEWVRLFAIDEIEPEITGPGYAKPLSVEFLKANDKLVLDTRFFDADFKARLVASINDFDDRCDGLLIHSENFQALNLLQERYREKVKCVYIDPPYNSVATEIIYKNGYKNSSWCTFLFNRLLISKRLLNPSGIFCVTIDDYELYNLKKIADSVFSSENFLSNVLIRNNPSGRSTVSGFAICHEYALFYAKNYFQCIVGRLPHSEKQKKRYDLNDDQGKSFEWENFRKSSAGSYRMDRPKQYFPIFFNKNSDKLRIPVCEWNEVDRKWTTNEVCNSDEIEIYPIDSQDRERVWNYGIERTRTSLDQMKVENKNGILEIYKKKYLQDSGILPRTWWDKPEYSARDNGTRILNYLFNQDKSFDFPKAVAAVQDSLRVGSLLDSEIILDYFAGSATTGHAVINLNREDNGNRKYILVEMADYFDTVLKPRIAKVVYSEKWKDGKPTDRNTGISHCVKYIRLESYEDTLNNLRFAEDEKETWIREHAEKRRETMEQNASLREDYMLRYLLAVETRGSRSLLNIDRFVDPWNYALTVKKPGSDEYRTTTVDLIETFNYLIGLRVVHISEPQYFDAAFTRIKDPEAPEGQKTRLVVDGDIKQQKQVSESKAAGLWKIQMIELTFPK